MGVNGQSERERFGRGDYQYAKEYIKELKDLRRMRLGVLWFNQYQFCRYW